VHYRVKILYTKARNTHVVYSFVNKIEATIFYTNACTLPFLVLKDFGWKREKK
jgi:hypothetical protein